MLFKPILWAHFYFFPFSSLEVSRETGYVYGGELRVAAMKFEISGLTVLPRLWYKALTDHPMLHVCSVSIQLNK